VSAWLGHNLGDPWQNHLVVNAMQAGTMVAVLCAALGFFVVLRGLSFIGHAVTDVGFTGGAGAALIGVSSLWGLLAFSAAAALGVGLLADRARERDVATGVVLALALGLGALFLSVGTQFASQPFSLLFGSVFAMDPDTMRDMVIVGAGALLTLAVIYRPLLYCSISPQAAAAHGVPVRWVSILFLLCMAVAVAEAAQVVGVLLCTALLIGPPATAACLARRPGSVLALAILLGVLETWAGIILSYDSYYWPPGHRGWPVSFFISTMAVLCYLLARYGPLPLAARARSPQGARA
jgi:zinc/manganese transport system permease protein